MNALLPIAAGLVALTISSACSAASLEDLCVYQTVSPEMSATISWQSVTDRQSYVQNDQDAIRKIFETVQAFKSGWQTPVGIWPKDATMISVYRYKKPVCQIVFDKEELYVRLKDDAGFSIRRLSRSDYVSLAAVSRSNERP